MNDALRQHQGRPRGAARPRPDLPDRARAADAALRRLAADDVPDAGRRAVLRRHLFPEARALRAARLPRSAAAASPRRIASRATAIAEQNQRLADALAIARAGRAAAASAARARAGRARSPSCKRTFDPRARRLRRRARSFRTPAELEFCLRAFATARRRGRAARSCARRSTRMADGGIHDQLGGGFCRYSVDARMDDSALREDALRQRAAARRCTPTLARVTGERALSRDVARDIVGWLVREMRAPDGAFYSSLDADSEGEEGKFYVWTPRRGARAMLDRANGRSPRRTTASTGRRTSRAHAWHLRVAAPLDAGRARARHRRCPTRRRGSPARRPRCSRRARQRVRPGRDDKILTSWNALAIAGARARRARARRAALGRPRVRRASTRFARTAVARRPAARDAARRRARTSTPISTTTRSCSRR